MRVALATCRDVPYLPDLDAAGLTTVETAYFAPGEAWAGDEREVVVKPTISAGAGHRPLSPRAPQRCARAHRRHPRGRAAAMVQPFQASVDEEGETALVFIDGLFSHALRKGAILRPEEVAPVRTTGIMAAEAMYDPELVLAASFEPDERGDMLRTARGTPVLLELEAVEPNLHFDQAPQGAALLAKAIASRAD